eukprot:CAMPEP_0177583300 /NCGR_PEP_ID=MMETSP0419_2-20121207/3243_1 /TAXON_ID=582737 /ORGANISM="Tetraselmis sp., Strain GSL018" /LENGTH=248 /DNA_ID=CAMNT_0019072671 /DNA_START=39 /DNA_END=787 /DNA_ORIENTATION=+
MIVNALLSNIVTRQCSLAPHPGPLPEEAFERMGGCAGMDGCALAASAPLLCYCLPHSRQPMAIRATPSASRPCLLPRGSLSRLHGHGGGGEETSCLKAVFVPATPSNPQGMAGGTMGSFKGPPSLLHPPPPSTNFRPCLGLRVLVGRTEVAGAARQQVKFLCNICLTETIRDVNPHAWYHGTVFLECSGCHIKHKVRDNLNLFHELSGPVFPGAPSVDALKTKFGWLRRRSWRLEEDDGGDEQPRPRK